MLVVPEATWDDFERLLDELTDHPGVRVSFDQGRLVAASRLRAHQHFARILGDIADIVADGYGLDLEAIGSTTLKCRTRAQGVEADAAFYVANAKRVAGRVTLDLSVDPPPDVAIEIDLWNDSVHKFPVYAALGVPEIWRYDGRHVEIRLLESGEYRMAAASKTFPVLTPQVMERFLELSRTASRSAARRACKQWVADPR